ncbi:MAG TPA: ATP-binding protein [Thermoanaerobaculia bacterium]|nr:ATP-binding protein [Thermoanaerobaculia bacterium]
MRPVPATDPPKGRLLWRNWPWAAKLALLLGTLAILPMAAITLYAAMTARQDLIESARQQNLQQARNTAQAIDLYLESVLSDVQVVALAPGTVRFLDGAHDPQLEEDVRLLLVTIRDTQGFDAFYLTDTAGTVRLASDPRFSGRTYVASRWFQNAISGNASFNEPRYDPEDRRVYIHASTPVRQADGRIVGTAVGRVTLAGIDGIIKADTGYAGRKEFGILWDADGIRLSHPTKPRLRFRAFEPVPGDVLTRLAAENRFGPHSRQIVTGAAPYPGILRRSRWLLYDAKANPQVRVGSGNRIFYVSIAPLGKARWLYGIFSPESAILATLEEETRRNLLLALLTAAVAAAVAFVAARWVTRPLREVGDAAQALAAGDMSRRVGLPQRDEVGRLGHAFDSMADALAAKEAELRGYAGQLEERVQEQTAELRVLYEREQELRRKAEEANRIKDEFLSTVSHELRTPLNAILGWTWLLASGSMDADGVKRAVATIERNARSQSQIVDDLLDVSRIITGKLRLQVDEVDLAHVIETAFDSLRPAADAKEIRIETRVEREAARVSGDPHRLQQVVWNLLSNAVKFTPRGGRIEVRLGRSGSQVELRVSDSGIGIAPDFLDHVFDRFRQADSSTTRTYGGLGLGLAIVRHLVELHGGTVHAESAGPGQGATFTVRLPVPAVRPAPGPEPLPSSPPSPEPSDAPELRGLRVLVVDDDADAREVLPALLEPFGVEVAVAASAAEGMDVLESRSIDVLVADIGMPEEDGYSLITRIRQRESLRDLPAIALTAYAGDGDRQKALAAGFQRHLAKPVEPHDLLSTVAAVAKGAVQEP